MPKGIFIKFIDIIKQGRWPVSDCIKNVQETEVDEYFFISHRWLSPKHPDPENNKWNTLNDWFKNLIKLQFELDKIEIKSVDKNKRVELINRRWENSPLLVKESNNNINLWLTGLLPNDPSWLDEDIEPAAKMFVEWLKQDIELTINSFFWIDSYATANPSHRAICSYCALKHSKILESIPLLVGESMCVKVNTSTKDESERGWILLEGAVVFMNEVLCGEYGNFNINFEKELFRIYSGKYLAFEKKDHLLIPRFYGLAYLESRFRGILRHSKAENLCFININLPKSVNDIGFIQHLKTIIFNQELEIVDSIFLLLNYLRSTKSIETFPGFIGSVDSGDITFQCLIYLIHGVLTLYFIQVNIAIDEPEHSTTVLQSCVYFFVCKLKLSSKDAVAQILLYWADITGTIKNINKSLIRCQFQEEVNYYVNYWSKPDSKIVIHRSEFYELC